MLNIPEKRPEYPYFHAAVDSGDVEAVKESIGWHIGCACIGPLPGDTLCPCGKRMEYVERFISVEALKQGRLELVSGDKK